MLYLIERIPQRTYVSIYIEEPGHRYFTFSPDIANAIRFSRYQADHIINFNPESADEFHKIPVPFNAFGGI